MGRVEQQPVGEYHAICQSAINRSWASRNRKGFALSSPNTAPQVRNLGGAKQAAAIAKVSPSTVRGWLQQGLIRGERTGNGRYRYDLDDVAAMVVEYPRDDVDDRIAELVEGAPEFSAAQINKIRCLLHATPTRGGSNVG
jgi:hypothetical protein